MRERLGEGDEDDGPDALAGEGALQEMVEKEGTARLDTVLDEGDAPRSAAAAPKPQCLVEEVGSGWRERRVHEFISPHLVRLALR